VNILQINEKDIVGGATACMMRLHEAFRERGQISRILVGRSEADMGEGCQVIPKQSLFSRFCYHDCNLMGLNFAGILGKRRITKHPFFMNADVVHLHNLQGGYFNYLWLMRISMLKPVVWTLHDMWALTGHCAHSFDCERWQTGCGQCPYPKTYPAVRRDATHWDWYLKQHVYQHSNITIVCPSKWLANLVQQSTLSHFPIYQIANGVDTDTYQPRDTAKAREKLRIPFNKRVLLFAADDLNNPFKDFQLLLESLKNLNPDMKKQLLLLTLGRSEAQEESFCGIPVHKLGYIKDDYLKSQVYSAADVFAFPTRADNQPLVLLEALACGCPAVATNVGGVPEIVRHKITGYLARKGDLIEFRAGLELLLGDDNLRKEMSVDCRKMIVNKYDIRAQVRGLISVYNNAIQSWRERQ
jgi:glycosyltransferase involved in cell wall biosynthesis